MGGGPFGMARLAHLLHQRLTPSMGERPGRPTDATWDNRPKVPMSEATQQRIAEIAEAISTPERRVSPMQVAAHLLEEAVGRIDAKGEVHLPEGNGAENRVISETMPVAPMAKAEPAAPEATGSMASASVRAKGARAAGCRQGKRETNEGQARSESPWARLQLNRRLNQARYLGHGGNKAAARQYQAGWAWSFAPNVSRNPLSCSASTRFSFAACSAFRSV